jgi:hypothetical protein
MLLGVLSAGGVLLGATIASMTDRYPRHKRNLEKLAGHLLIAGFALLGCALQSVFGPCLP